MRKDMLVKKKFVLNTLLILLATGIAFGFATTSNVSGAQDRSVHELAQAVPAWHQVNSNGFGDPQTVEVTALEVFKGYLYAGTHHPVNPILTYDGAQIFRSPDGVAWTPVTQPGFHDPHDSKPPAILDLVVFNGYLYASTGRGNAAQIWRSLDGVIWAPMVAAGFGDPDNVDITALAAYNNKIYAGVANSNTGAQIWRSSTGDNAVGSWTKVAPGAGMAATRITGFAAFNSALYAALESTGSVQIWSSSSGDLNTWATSVNNGFGDSNNTSAGGMAVFGGYLYVGAGNSVDGARLYRTNNGTSWGQAITPGFGDPNNQKVETVFVFQNQLYVSVKNAVTGMELWRSPDGTLWERANQDGFGDSNNSGSNWSNATADFLSHLYVGTSNIVSGGELWRMVQPGVLSVYIPLSRRSP